MKNKTFEQEFKELICKYDVDLQFVDNSYGNLPGVNFCVGEKIVCSAAKDGGWNFGDGFMPLYAIADSLSNVKRSDDTND